MTTPPDTRAEAPPPCGRVDAWSRDAAEGAVVQTLLRCWLREHGIVPPAGGELHLDLAGARLEAAVLGASPTGWHRFGPVRLGDEPVDVRGLAAAMARDLAAQTGLPASRCGDLVQRTLDSVERIAAHVAHRVGEHPQLPPTFLDAEQGLVAGHPFHPAAKGREGWAEGEHAAYSPELRGSFALRWLAVERDLVVTGSAAARPAEALLGELPDVPRSRPGFVAVPLHPWQAEAALARPGLAPFFDRGALQDLGAGPTRWSPTSSLRTVWHPHARWMLKLSLGVRITNSRRDNRRNELRLGEQAHRLLAAGLGRELAAAHPRFRVITDPAWVGADVPGGGFELALRHNPFRLGHRAVCVAALVDERPGLGGPVLAQVLHASARRRRLPVHHVAHRWLSRFVVELIAPLAWLDGTHGVVLEAHQQNTLVTLDDDGWPVGGWYRDSQGWYVARSTAPALQRSLPELGDGVDVVFDDELVAQRGAYYLGVNNLLGLVGALGAAGVDDEERLLRVVRAALEGLPRSPVLDVLLERPTIACKANLLTCADGRDELAGPVSQQSVYVEVPNPLVEVAA